MCFLKPLSKCLKCHLHVSFAEFFVLISSQIQEIEGSGVLAVTHPSAHPEPGYFHLEQ